MIAVTPQTTRNWAVAGRIPGIRVGGSWRFWRPALLAAVAGTEITDRSVSDPADVAEPEVVSISQLADLLGVHANTVNLLLRQGSLPGRKIGGRWRVYWPAVRDAIAAGEPLRSATDAPMVREKPS